MPVQNAGHSLVEMVAFIAVLAVLAAVFITGAVKDDLSSSASGLASIVAADIRRVQFVAESESAIMKIVFTPGGYSVYKEGKEMVDGHFPVVYRELGFDRLSTGEAVLTIDADGVPSDDGEAELEEDVVLNIVAADRVLKQVVITANTGCIFIREPE